MIKQDEISELIEQLTKTLDAAQNKSTKFVADNTPAVVSFVEKYWWAIGIGALAIGVGTILKKKGD